jgi:hypothetical protein
MELRVNVGAAESRDEEAGLTTETQRHREKSKGRGKS